MRPPLPRRVLAHALALAPVVAAAVGAAPARAQTTPATPAAPTAAPLAASTAGMVVLRGTVYDSLARGPLVGATVQAARADDPTAAFSSPTDSAGAFRLPALAPGRYVLGFLHPLLDVLGIEVKPLLVDLTAGASGEVALALPGPAGVRAALCPALAPGDSAGAVAGAVYDADTGAPASDATVVFTWSELALTRGGVRTERRRVPVTVRPDGGYLVCGLPSDGAVEVSAAAPGRTSGLVEVAAPARGIAVQSLAVGPAAPAPPPAPGDSLARGDSAAQATVGGLPTPARGTARLTGRVVTDDGAPVRGARVRVWGTAGLGETGEDGAFALAELPAGTFTLEARAIGREPTRVVVHLANGRSALARVAMPKPAVQLERVVVRGKASRASRDIDGFLARQRSGLGTYFTRADIERRNPLEVTDLFRATAGLRVVPTGSRGNAVRGRGGCQPAVYLDGMYIQGGADEIDLLVRPNAVQAIEVYRGGATVPPQFNMTTGGSGALMGGGACGGAVVLWTRR